jgi:3-methyl-2-oxobutanoate hydroxymethyltransferase
LSAGIIAVLAGGFRPQAQVASEALRVLDQAKALQAAGCFSIVLECIPGPIAAAITKALKVPTIGIGAGPATSGQVRTDGLSLGKQLQVGQNCISGLVCQAEAQVAKLLETCRL